MSRPNDEAGTDPEFDQYDRQLDEGTTKTTAESRLGKVQGDFITYQQYFGKDTWRRTQPADTNLPEGATKVVLTRDFPGGNRTLNCSVLAYKTDNVVIPNPRDAPRANEQKSDYSGYPVGTLTDGRWLLPYRKSTPREDTWRYQNDKWNIVDFKDYIQPTYEPPSETFDSEEGPARTPPEVAPDSGTEM